MKQEDSDGTVRIFSARACAAPLEKKEKSNTTLRSRASLRSTRAIWPSAVLVLVFTQPLGGAGFTTTGIWNGDTLTYTDEDTYVRVSPCQSFSQCLGADTYRQNR